MSKDYAKARDDSSRNARNHIEASESLLNSGHPGFAIAHGILCFEEAAKAVYCAMVHAGYLRGIDIEKVFREHTPKAFLYSAIFESDLTIEAKNGGFEISVHGEALVQRIRKGINDKLAAQELHRQKNLKEGGLYVGFDHAGLVQAPQDTSPEEAKEIIRELKGKSVPLLGFREMVSSSVKDFFWAKAGTVIGEFRVIRVNLAAGEVVISWAAR